MLEKMSDFFEARLDGYDEHMMTNIESANEFYPFTAKQLPTTENCHVLDLFGLWHGIGTSRILPFESVSNGYGNRPFTKKDNKTKAKNCEQGNNIDARLVF